MFKVEGDYNKYKISIGTGRTTRANSIEEVIEALKHYHSLPHDKNVCAFCNH